MVLFIKYYEELKQFVMCGLLESKEGIIPIGSKKIDLGSCPDLSEKLMEGKTIYIDSYSCYLGKEKTEGPYCEQKVFCSEYESHNCQVPELLLSINNKIKDKKRSPKKLIKIGEHYR